MNSIRFVFDNPWWLLLLIPGVFVTLWPYFRMKKKYRRTRNRIVPLVLHLVIVLMLTSLASGFTVRTEAVSIKKDVLIVVDVSESTEPSKNQINDFIKLIIADSGNEYRLGIVAFAAEPQYSVKLTGNTRRVFQDYEDSDKPRGGASNIEKALLFAKNQFANPQDGRIILISDGLETDGAAFAAARSVANDGIRIDTVFFSSGASGKEVKIVSVDVPDRIGLNDSADVSVTVRSASVGNAKLQLFAGGVLYSERQVRLSGGTDTFAFTYVPKTPNLHELRVKIISENDEIVQNNEYWSFINILNENPRILLLEAVAGESTKLYNLLSGDFIVDVLNIANAPDAISGLQVYDEIVLVNVANSDMPTGFDELLSAYVSIYGGGLFTAGGSRAYQQADMGETLYEGMLPVKITETINYSLGLMIMIDTSSSMYRENVNPAYLNVGTRLDRAKQAARDIISNYSSNRDYIGIMQFDGGTRIRAQMTPATQKASLLSAVDAIVEGSGSVYTDALRQSDSVLTTFTSTDIKHVLFISDGDVQNDTQYLDAVSMMANHGIKLSVLGIGSGGSTNTGVLAAIAERGKGSYHQALQDDYQTIVSGLAREIIEAAKGSADSSGSFTPEIYRHTPVVQGVTKLPETEGYYGAQAKNAEDIVLKVSAGGDPFYVEWAYGNGRSGSLMCDLSGIWSKNYFTDPQGILFLKNIIKSLLPSAPIRNRDISADFAAQNMTSLVEIETRVAAGDILEATLTAPDGSAEKISLTRQSENVHSALISTGIPGIYALEITKKDRTGSLISQTVEYTAFSYSDEYAGFADIAACSDFMTSIAEIGGGRVLYATDKLFGAKAESVTTHYDPRIIFLSLSIGLFLLDIVFRKFKMKRSADVKPKQMTVAASE